MRCFAAFFFAILMLGSSYSQSLALENGHYSDAELSLTVKGSNVSLDVAVPGCQGDLQGKIKKSGKDKWVLRAEGCFIEFTQKGKRITIEEKEYCPMHGASCAFEGVVIRK